MQGAAIPGKLQVFVEDLSFEGNYPG